MLVHVSLIYIASPNFILIIIITIIMLENTHIIIVNLFS